MKKIILLTTIIFMVAVVALAYAGSAKMNLKVGDEIYACNCGADCPCNTMSRSASAKCTCGKDMVKAKVMKIEGDTAMLKAEAWDKERPFKMTGKYMCDCGAECKCDTISQNPGKCACAKDMKKVE